MGLRDLFGHKAQTTEDLVARAEAARAHSDPLTQISQLARSGEKIEAIKLYREEYGVGLADAKDAVDAIARGESPASQAQAALPASGPDKAVRALAADGELIDAIKLYRELHGVGLKEAKDAVEAMRS